MNSRQWYEQNAATLISAYESLRTEDVHGWLLNLIPDHPSLVLDVGAGSGRDASWLAALGHKVIAVEPIAAMREEGYRLHPHPKICWIDDRLPALQKVHRLGVTFHFILLSAVWMHIPPTERSWAFQKLITLLKPGGLLAITLRHGAAEAERGMYEVTGEELEGLAQEYGATIIRQVEESDRLGRSAGAIGCVMDEPSFIEKMGLKPCLGSNRFVTSPALTTIPLWSISCTLISDALMHQKHNNSMSKPAECGIHALLPPQPDWR